LADAAIFARITNDIGHLIRHGLGTSNSYAAIRRLIDPNA
jgi:hypothetical protein